MKTVKQTSMLSATIMLIVFIIGVSISVWIFTIYEPARGEWTDAKTFAVIGHVGFAALWTLLMVWIGDWIDENRKGS